MSPVLDTEGDDHAVCTGGKADATTPAAGHSVETGIASSGAEPPPRGAGRTKIPFLSVAGFAENVDLRVVAVS